MSQRKPARTSEAKVAAVRVETLRLDTLVTPDYNNRTITDAALQGLTQSLADFGLLALPVVNVKNGRNVIVGGNQRVKVLRDAGEESASCIVVELDADGEHLASFTLNNRAIQGEFVPHLVQEVMDRIRAGAGDDHERLFKRLRFDALYRSTMRNMATATASATAEPRKGRVADDDTPALLRTDPESRPGRYYQLGDHLLYCGKIAEPGTLKNFGAGHADMAFSRLVHAERFKDAYVDVHVAHLLANTEGAIYLATSFDHIAQIHARFIALGGHWSTTIVAHESQRAGRREVLYRDVTLPVIYGWREGAKHFFFGGRDKSNLLKLTAATPKGDVPVELAVFAMQNSSRPGDTVLDVHVAQGATVIAAEKSGRKLLGYVQSAREMDRVRHRWTRFVFGDKANWRTKTGEAS